MLNASSSQHFFHHVFHHIDDVFALNERHLDVHLGKLRLTVGAQVLIAEAASNLIIALNAGNHKHLLELLRALRQRVELAGVRTARHNVVTCAFRRAVCQDRRFNFNEVALVECLAHGLSHNVTQLDGGVHLGTTQVHITPLHTRFFGNGNAVLDLKRRRNGLVQHHNGRSKHFNLARKHVRVHGFFATSTHFARDFQNVFAAQMLGDGELIGGYAIGVNDDLGVAIAIAQVAEDNAAVVARMPRPTSQHNLAPNVFFAQLATSGGMHAVLIFEIGHSCSFITAKRLESPFIQHSCGFTPRKTPSSCISCAPWPRARPLAQPLRSTTHQTASPAANHQRRQTFILLACHAS